MIAYVIDASVAIKWYVPEVHDAEAHRLRASSTPLHCPGFLAVEVTAILWKKIRRDGFLRSDADDILKELNNAPMTWHPTASLVPAAFDLADRSNRSVYDCLYLALAVQPGGAMVTADDRLVNALAGTPWAGHVLKLSAVP